MEIWDLNPVRQSRRRFLQDVQKGLMRKPKRLHSKYFYDEKGSHLFEQIMALPEYYPSRCENEILKTHAKDIISKAAGKKGLLLVDLGSGDGAKTEHLLPYIENTNGAYWPVDISHAAIEEQLTRLEKKHSQLRCIGLIGEFTQALRKVREARPKGVPVLALFLGGNIGNFDDRGAMAFLRGIWQSLLPGDSLLIGFDLQKDPHQIERAYDDAGGVTAEFNLNLLDRINEELDSDFDRKNFKHYATYNPILGVCQSFLVSVKKQTIHIGGQLFVLEAFECLHTENSYKYTFAQIEELARRIGFAVEHHYTDSKGWFTSSLWRR